MWSRATVLASVVRCCEYAKRQLEPRGKNSSSLTFIIRKLGKLIVILTRFQIK
jgi:hypothetical protein